MRLRTLVEALPVVLLALAGCGSSSNEVPDGGSQAHPDAPVIMPDAGTPADEGALIDVTMDSTVGVLLDEIPAGSRDRVAAAIIAKPAQFWKDRAASQLRLASYRLVFRAAFYDDDKGSLPTPPQSIWNFTLKGAPARKTIDGHDLVAVDYTFASTLVTDAVSPGVVEPMLDAVGGAWDEPFTFPVDPEMIFQRTRFACMDEAEFPPESVDSEETDSFYDDTCDVEDELTRTACHQTELPDMSCVDALTAKIGHIDTNLHFERVAYDATRAAAVRVGPVTHAVGADLEVVDEQFRVNRTIYRYIAPDSCTLVEQCIGAPGWRRLLQFSTADRNVGGSTMVIGAVDLVGDGDGGTEVSEHGEFEYSPCHRHYHFMHYGSFTYGDGAGVASTTKRGFCLQSTNRFSNEEISPLSNIFFDCSYQGVEIGWGDEYKAGLQCQWIDVTGVDTGAGPVTRDLSFTYNPDGFLCEGTPVLDANGDQVWEPTTFHTAAGGPVDRPSCDFVSDYASNNQDSYPLTLATPGEGYVTAACARGQIGPLRNCGFTKAAENLPCVPGTPRLMQCTAAAGAQPQVVRVCDYSAVLGTGIPCTYQEGLASTVIDTAGEQVAFTCPAARDANEPGGTYSLYTAALFDDDQPAAVTCIPLLPI